MTARFKYEHILEKLTLAIQSGEYPPGSKLPSAQEIAGSFGTSQITANKALNLLASRGYIKRSTGSGSIVISKTGNEVVRRPFQQVSQLIGVVVFDISHPFWASTISGIESVCRLHGFNLLIGNDDGNNEKAELYIRNFIAQGVKGLILVPIGMPDKSSYEKENVRLIRIIEESNTPYVLLHRRVDSTRTSYTQLENYHSSFESTKLLLQTGVTNPICISQYYSHVVADRNRGFIDALTLAGFTDAPDRIHYLHPIGQTVSSRELTEVVNILEHVPKYDGLMTITADMLDLVLLAGKNLLDISGLKIISFDYNNLLFSHKGIIAMVETPSAAMGHKACEILFGKITKSCNFEQQVTLLPVLHVKKNVKRELDSLNEEIPEKAVYHN